MKQSKSFLLHYQYRFFMYIFNISAKKNLFLQEIRIHYEKLCQTICPIPFIKEKMFSVDDLYVEGGIEISMPLNMDTMSGRDLIHTMTFSTLS